MSVTEEQNGDRDEDKSDRSVGHDDERAKKPRLSFSCSTSGSEPERVTQLKNQKSKATENESRKEVSEQTNGCDQRAHNERAQHTPPPPLLSKRQILDAENLLAADAGQRPPPAAAGELCAIDFKQDEDETRRTREQRESAPQEILAVQPEDANQQSIAMISSNTRGHHVIQQQAHRTSEAHHAPSQNQPANTSEIRGFSQVQPRLSATSKRMRDYIETFRRARQQRTSYERSHVYQFFKCARTELAASLLFSLIVCYSLISCKTATSSLSLDQSASSSSSQRLIPGEVSSDQVHAYLEHASNLQDDSAAKLRVHLISGLVAAFAVATLTQVFGHVSGCHLLPSVSLALYLKGHISRARLVAYLAAQSAGSLLGVALLALLTSSQVTTVQYLPSRVQVGLSSPAPDGLVSTPAAIADVVERRKRSLKQPLSVLSSDNFTSDNRQELAARNIAGDDDDELYSSVISPSETILVSIEEQRERELAARRQSHQERQQQSITGPPQTSRAPHARNSAGNGDDDHHDDGPSFGNHLRVSVPQEGFSNPSAPPQSNGTIATGLIASGQVAPTDQTQHRPGGEGGPPSVQVISSKRAVAAQPAAASSGQQLVMVPLNSDFSSSSGSSNDSSPAASVRNEVLRASTAVPESAHELDAPAPPLKRDDLARTRTPVDAAQKSAPLPPLSQQQQQQQQPAQRKLLKRKKRARRKQPLTAGNATNSTTTTTASNAEEIGQKSVRVIYVNLLQLALPDEIMTSDSVRECLRTEQQDRDSNLSHLGTERGLNHCLGSSNGSQMFIFQLLGTLLINLTYLVNVDQRRSDDLGHKSLSIGLAYFLAHALALNSGGFCGSPVQLLALASLATGREPSSSSSPSLWRPEWTIYLIVPLIGGLFSAISHEYIDFTSARRRQSKTKLGLRRSFFSLEDLHGGGGGGEVGASGGGVADSDNSLATPTSEIGLDNDDLRAGPRAAMRKLSAPTTGENHKLRHKRLSSSSAAAAMGVENSLAATTSSDDGHGSMGANSSLATLHLTDMNNNNNQHSTNELKVKSASSGYLRGSENAQHECGFKPSARSRTASILLDSNFLISCPSAQSRAQPAAAAALASSTNRRTQQQHRRRCYPPPSQFTCTTSQFM